MATNLQQRWDPPVTKPGKSKTGTPRIFYKLQIFITEVKQYQGFQIVAVYIALGVFC
jgi:hypothetical protein